MAPAAFRSFGLIRTLGFLAILHEWAFIIGEDCHLARVFVVMKRVATQGKVAQNATKGHLKIFAREGRLGRAIAQDCALHQNRPVAKLRHRAKVMGRNQHNTPFSA